MDSSFSSESHLTSSLPSLDKIVECVISSATLMQHKSSAPLSKKTKIDDSIVTEIDHAIQDHLQQNLFENWPQYGFLGEEMSHQQQQRIVQQNKQGYWVADPLDGTTNFASGFLFYGISLVLIVNAEPVLAVIYDPVRKECFSAEKGQGARLNSKELICPKVYNLADCVANVDYKRLVGDLSEQLVRCPPYRSQRNLGASVLEWCWLASGRIQLYLHGGQKLWDFAAGYLILLEAGGAATSLSGTPLDCSGLRKRSIVAAVTPELLDKWIKWIDIP